MYRIEYSINVDTNDILYARLIDIMAMQLRELAIPNDRKALLDDWVGPEHPNGNIKREVLVYDETVARAMFKGLTDESVGT